VDRARLISDDYTVLNAKLHALGKYGVHGDKWAKTVKALVKAHRIATVLDYGCGQGALARALGDTVAEYDPAIPGKDGDPAPAELVICTDVLEHIEPALIDNVLDHLAALAQRYLFVAVSTRPAVKFLADGRNAHLIVQPAAAWRPLFAARFSIVEWTVRSDEFVALLAGKAR
jgi:hypothetical protein